MLAMLAMLAMQCYNSYDDPMLHCATLAMLCHLALRYASEADYAG